MSRLNFATLHKGLPVNVLAGFDNNCQWYFMVVEAEDDDNPNIGLSEYIYSNLDDPNVPMDIYKQLAYFKEKLNSLGIEVEQGFFEKVEVESD